MDTFRHISFTLEQRSARLTDTAAAQGIAPIAKVPLDPGGWQADGRTVVWRVHVPSKRPDGIQIALRQAAVLSPAR